MSTYPTHRTLYLSHGGGPLPLLGDNGHAEMVTRLRTIVTELPRPSTILVISAHWEEERPTITGASTPMLFYDYSGFPEPAYNIRYPAPGAPDLAQQLFDCLKESGMQPAIDPARGFDHGLFVPLKIMYPDADIPCLQLSLVKTLDPELHIRVGEALAQVEHNDLLIVGSGFSFHNMRAFFQQESGEDRAKNIAFEDWLITTCADRTMDEATRRQRLLGWEQAPYARFCHPREEHLLPLHVCYGIQRSASSTYHELTILGKKASFYLW